MSYSKAVDQTLAELAAVAERIDENQLVALEDHILGARRIVLAGVGREGLATRFFTMRLGHLDFDSTWVWDDTAPDVGPDDLFIMTNGSGEIAHLDAVAEVVVSTGCPLVVVTGVPTGKTAQRAELVVHVPAAVYKGEGDLVPTHHPMGTLFEQSLVILFDEMVLRLAARKGIDPNQMSGRHRNYE